MKLVKCNTTLVTEKKYPDLIDVKFEHEIKSTKASFFWLGPKIPPDVWHQVLSFFKWTYDTTKSESQVRLYVNPKEKTWEAWAYPQEARTGMTAKELPDHPKTKDQRALFPDSEGWIYFGTVHHHCDCSAFQSGTDEYNERTQAGLHITVGNMAKEQHDLHCRFYLNGACFDPDMSLFWQIGDDIAKRLPPEFHDRVARYQMGRMSDMPFPDLWKENLIEIKPAMQAIGLGYFPERGTVQYPQPIGYSPGNHTYGPIWKRAQKAVADIIKETADAGYTSKDVQDVMTFIEQDGVYGIIAANLSCYKLDFDELKAEWPTETEMALKFCQQLQIQDKKEGADKSTATPKETSIPTGEVWGGMGD